MLSNLFFKSVLLPVLLPRVLKFSKRVTLCCIVGCTLACQISGCTTSQVWHMDRWDDTPRSRLQETPFDSRIGEVLLIDSQLNINVYLNAKSQLRANELVVLLKAINKGDVVEEQSRYLGQAVGEWGLNPGESAQFRFVLNSKEVTDYQINFLWGQDAKEYITKNNLTLDNSMGGKISLKRQVVNLKSAQNHSIQNEGAEVPDDFKNPQAESSKNPDSSKQIIREKSVKNQDALKQTSNVQNAENLSVGSKKQEKSSYALNIIEVTKEDIGKVCPDNDPSPKNCKKKVQISVLLENRSNKVINEVQLQLIGLQPAPNTEKTVQGKKSNTKNGKKAEVTKKASKNSKTKKSTTSNSNVDKVVFQKDLQLTNLELAPQKRKLVKIKFDSNLRIFKPKIKVLSSN